MAVERAGQAEAMELAERAHGLAPLNANVIDTHERS